MLPPFHLCCNKQHQKLFPDLQNQQIFRQSILNHLMGKLDLQIAMYLNENEKRIFINHNWKYFVFLKFSPVYSCLVFYLGYHKDQNSGCASNDRMFGWNILICGLFFSSKASLFSISLATKKNIFLRTKLCYATCIT